MFRTLYGGAPETAWRLELEYEPAAGGGPPRLELDWTQGEDSGTIVSRLGRAAAALAGAHTGARLTADLEVMDQQAAAHDCGGADAAGAAAGAPYLVDSPTASAAGVGTTRSTPIVTAAEWRDESFALPAWTGLPAVQQQQPQPHVQLRLRVTAAPPVLRSVTFSRSSGSASANEALVTSLLAQLDTSRVARLRLCDGLGWAAAAWAVEPARWGGLRALYLSGCGLGSLPPMIANLAGLQVHGCATRGVGGAGGEPFGKGRARARLTALRPRAGAEPAPRAGIHDACLPACPVSRRCG